MKKGNRLREVFEYVNRVKLNENDLEYYHVDNTAPNDQMSSIGSEIGDIQEQGDVNYNSFVYLEPDGHRITILGFDDVKELSPEQQQSYKQQLEIQKDAGKLNPFGEDMLNYLQKKYPTPMV